MKNTNTVHRTTRLKTIIKAHVHVYVGWNLELISTKKVSAKQIDLLCKALLYP